MVDLTNFDKFYRDFELAQTPEEKSKLIELFTSENEISDEDLCEFFFISIVFPKVSCLVSESGSRFQLIPYRNEYVVFQLDLE